MKKLFTSFFILVSSFVFCQAPTFQWVKGYLRSFGGDINPRSVVSDGANNVYTSGDFSGIAYFDPLSSSPLTSGGSGPAFDLFVVMHDPLGNVVWSTQIDNGDDEKCYQMAQSPNGNILVTGYNQFVGSGRMIVVASLSGSVLWDNVITAPTPTTNGVGVGYGITSDASNNVYSVGSYIDTLDFDSGPGTFTLPATPGGGGFVLKHGVAGNFIWVKGLSGTSVSECYSIVSDNSGNTYVTGYFFGVADFDPGPGTYSLSNSISTNTASGYVWKLSSAGNLMWAKNVDHSYGKSITLDNFSNIYYAGEFISTVDFDPGPGTFTLDPAFGNNFICKMDASGNFIWAKQLYGTISSITTDAMGNPYVSGYFNSTIDADPGPSTYTLASMGGYDGFITKLDASGNFIWAAQNGGTYFLDNSDDISVNSAGEVFSVGVCDPNTDFDPGPGVYTLFPFGSFYSYVLKLGQTSTGINKIEVSNNLKIFPNPTNGQFNLNFNKVKVKTEIKIFNSLGQLVLEKNISSTDKISLSISDQPSGIYFVEVNADGESYRTKVVKE